MTAATQQPALISIIILSLELLEKMVKVLSLRLGVDVPVLAIVSAGHSDGRPIRGKYFPKMGSNPDSVVKNNLTACSP